MSKLKNLWRMASGPVRERGWAETVRSVRTVLRERRRARTAPFDAAFGTDTERSVTLSDLDATGDDVPALWRYWPTSHETFRDIMDDVSVPFERTVFVDLGSGKGRVLLMAAEYPFRRIVGVELSPGLHRTAVDNVRRWRASTHSSASFELRCLDAAEWEPPSEELLIYLFQPFPVETMRTVLSRLAWRLTAIRRPDIHIAYLNPLHHELIVGSGAFTLVHWGRARQKGAFDWAVYRSCVTPLV